MWEMAHEEIRKDIAYTCLTADGVGTGEMSIDQDEFIFAYDGDRFLEYEEAPDWLVAR